MRTKPYSNQLVINTAIKIDYYLLYPSQYHCYNNSNSSTYLMETEYLSSTQITYFDAEFIFTCDFRQKKIVSLI